MKDKIKFIDLFSGIGGFRLGLEKASERFRCVWSCDWDKYANKIYTERFGEENHYPSDVRGVNAEEIPDFDLLCAGFPCQSFSVAGKRKGFQDPRGTLFFEICRIAKAKRPPLLLLENVRGLLSNDRGQTFYTVLRELGRIGYWVEWQVLNSKHFGVPQNRERVFIIGHLGNGGGREVFPVFSASGGSAETCGASQTEGSRVRVANTLSSRYYKDGSENLILYNGHHKSFTEDMGTLTGRENRRGTNWTLVYFLAHTKGNIKKRVRKADLAWCLGGSDTRIVEMDFKRVRRLTPVECERLQGFPDGWTEGVSDTQRYKLLGNAVTVNVVEFLGKRILERCA